MKYSIKQNQIILTHLLEVEGKTSQEFLQLFKVSKKNSKRLLAEKCILLNNQVMKQDDVIKKEDSLKISLPCDEIDYACEQQPAIIVYEDDLVLIAHKCAGMIVHDDNKNKLGTLANEVAAYYQQSGYQISVRYLHRLDEDTQGLVMFCKVPLFQPWFDDQLKNKNIERIYHAITYNKLPQKSMVINAPLGRDRHDAKRMRISKSGKDAITRVKELKTNSKYSLIECSLETGRTHQIRVHLASIGCPIVNDKLYGLKTADFSDMGLYAMSLSWMDPFTKEKRIVLDSQVNYIFK